MYLWGMSNETNNNIMTLKTRNNTKECKLYTDPNKEYHVYFVNSHNQLMECDILRQRTLKTMRFSRTISRKSPEAMKAFLIANNVDTAFMEHLV